MQHRFKIEAQAAASWDGTPSSSCLAPILVTRYSRTERKSRVNQLPALRLTAAASPLAGHSWTLRGLPQLPPFPHPRQSVTTTMMMIFYFFAADLPGSLFFPHQAGGSACWPPSAMPHSIVLYKQRILAKIQKTLPRKKGKL